MAALRAEPTRDEDWIDTVRRALDQAQLLLVLDNCEHVVEAARAIVTAAATTHGPHVLATSRELLAHPAEHAVEVPRLATPTRELRDRSAIGSSPAVALFVERASAVDPGFELTDENAPVVAELCRSLDGLPLALELAAARLDVTTVQDLVRGPAFVASSGDAHRSGRVGGVAEALAWTYDRLAEASARLFRTLAVFSGSFTPEMAIAVAGDAADRAEFEALVRTSVVARDPLTPDRFRLLDTARQFARARCGDQEWHHVQQSHADLMLSRAVQWGPRIETDEAATSLGVLREDLADHRRAVAWYVGEGATDRAARMVVELFMFSLCDLHPELNELSAVVAERIANRDDLASEVIGAAALGAWYTGDTERAISLGLRAVRASDEWGGSTVWASTALVNALGYTGRVAELGVHFQSLVAQERGSESPFHQVNGLGFQAISHSMFGQVDRARAKAEQALAIARRIGNPYCANWALYAYGRALTPVDPPSACEAFEASIRAAREVDSLFNVALAMVEWLALRRRLGHLEDCTAGALDVVDMLMLSGNRSQMSGILREIAHILARAGDAKTAAIALVARRGLPEMPGGAGGPDDALVEEVRAALGDRWSAAEMRALGMPEQELLRVCRRALTSIAVNA
jgi:predicted ATPase